MTTENNKIIAEFIELTQTEVNYYYFPMFERAFRLGDLKFHSDWNWLMEVVEKIGEKADWSLELLTTDKKEHQMLIPLSNTNIITETKIEAVYNACVEFIKWYNLQNKTT